MLEWPRHFWDTTLVSRFRSVSASALPILAAFLSWGGGLSGGPLFSGVLSAQESGAGTSPAPVSAVLPVETFQLDNGLTVVLSEDHSAPITAVSVWYHVGGAHEFEGYTGLAHLLEHLLGSRVRALSEADVERLVEDAGGVASASTDVDRTAFEMVVPAGALELAVWIQAGRMADPALSDSLVRRATAAVATEARAQIDAQPYARSQIVVDTLVSAYGPYRNPLVGRPSLEEVDASVVRRFHDLYYVPANAVLTIAGDASRTRVETLVRRYFGSLDDRPASPRLPPFPIVPAGAAESRATVEDPVAAAPLLWVAYAVPEAVDEDLYALSLLSSVISAGPSSRLNSVLVGRTQVARTVVSVLNRRRGPGSLLLGALPTEGTEPERLETVILSVIDVIREDGVTEAELEKAKNQRRATEVAARLTLAGRAAELQRHQLYGGRAVRANSEMERYDAVTPEDVLRVARRYLIPENRAVVVVLPGGLGLAASAGLLGLAAPSELGAAEESVSAQHGPPEVAPPAPPAFPGLEERSLSNGTGVLIVPDSLLPWVDVSLMLPGGKSADPALGAGTAELVSHLITRGTDRRSSADLAGAVDRIGATLAAVVGTDWITVSLGSLTPHLDSALTLMADVVLRASFPQAEVQRLRRQGVIALETGWAEPQAMAVRMFRHAVYVSHPYGLYERPEEVHDLSAADLRAYHRRVFRPEGAVFLVSGDIESDDVVSLLKAHFSGWAAGTETPTAEAPPRGPEPLGAPPAEGGRRGESVIVHTPGSTRAVIRMGHQLPAGDHPDWAGLSLLGQLLGGGPQARLGRRLRAHGWSGAAVAAVSRRRGPGLLEVDLDVRVEVADSAIAEVMAALEELRSEAPGLEETEAFKSFIAASLPLRLATARQVVGQVGRFRLLRGGSDAAGGSSLALEDYAAAVRALTPDELLRIAGEHLRPEDVTVVVVGDATLLRPRLATVGPVRMVDMDGGTIDLADLMPPVTPLTTDVSSLGPGTWTYRITVDGSVIGEMVRTLARDPDGTPERFSLRSSTTVGPQVLVQEVTFDGREFRPLSGSFELTQGRQRAGARLDIVDGRVVGDRILPDGRTEPFEAPLAPGSLVGEMLEVAVWLADLQEGLELVLPVVQVESGAAAHVRVRVLDRTRVTVPAGRYDAYRIEIQGAQATQLVYARVRAPHVIVKLETSGQPFIMELESEVVGRGG